MRSTSRLRTSTTTGVIAACLTWLPAAAQEYCVGCKGPDALYRCVIDDARPGATVSLPVACIGALAKAGPHESCVVRRDLGVIDCNGPIKHVSVAGPDNAAKLVEPKPSAVPPNVNSPADAGPPKTVAEMLQRAKAQNDKAWQKTSKQVQSNNEKIGGFFQKSWTCLSSLFSHCSND